MRRKPPTIQDDPAFDFTPGPKAPQPGRRWWLSKRALALAAVAVLGVAGVTGWWLHRGDARGLHAITPGTVGGLTELTPQQTTFNMLTIYIYASGKDVEILRLRPVATPNVAYLGAITVWPRNDGDSALLGGPGFPGDIQRHYHPAIGVVIPAAETSYRYPGESTPRPISVTAGFRLTSGSIGAVNHVEVTYRVGGERKSENSRFALVACIKCNGPAPHQGVGAWEEAVLAQFGMKESDT